MKSLALTIDALTKSRNEAATPTLIAALAAPQPEIFAGAVAALVGRRSKSGHLAVLGRWHELPPSLRTLVDASQGRMGGALRDGLLSTDDQLFFNACEVVHGSGEFDLAPTLILVAEQADSPRSRLAMKLVAEMVHRLVRSDAEPEAAGYSRHPETIRRSVLESLERSIERYHAHERVELIEAFLTLAGPESAQLQAVLAATHHPCQQTVVNVLTTSASPNVLSLLIAFMLRHDAPAAVRGVVAKRVDGAFVDALLGMPLESQNAALAKNLSRMKSVACLELLAADRANATPAQQAAAMWLLGRTAAADEVKLDLADKLLARSAPPARLAACLALAPIAGQRSNDLVLAALEDADEQVQAAAVRQLRDRHIPGTLARLIELVGSPLPAVRDAARDALAEFSIDNYLARYETMDDATRRSTGALVASIDKNTLPRLRTELASPVRRQRLRGLQVAATLGVVPQLADALVERLGDEDHIVRTAAAEALEFCTGTDVRDALLAALGDRSVAVQNAARVSLRAFGAAAAATPTASTEQLA